MFPIIQDDPPSNLSKGFRQRAASYLPDIERSSPETISNVLQESERLQSPDQHLILIEWLFGRLLKSYRMRHGNNNGQEAETLREEYEKQFESVLGRIGDEDELHHRRTREQVQALSTAMTLIFYESRYPLKEHKTIPQNSPILPLVKFKAVIVRLLSSERDQTLAISKFVEYFQSSPELLLVAWKVLPSTQHSKYKPNECYIGNCLSLLEKMDVKLMSVGEQGDRSFHFDESIAVKNLNRVWQRVMHWEHSPQTHKRLLILLLEKVLTHLEKPLLLTDFFMDSLDAGGAIGLLALQGIFTMIQVHNLSYPNLFAKLYSMFEPEIFHTKHKARLFYLSDMFLQSTHLSETLVAAFIKRLARLALVAQSEDVIVICQFIGNLIIRHPGLKCMLHNSKPAPVRADPYIMDERDPLKSDAIFSSLWELETLLCHHEPSVATAAKTIIKAPTPGVEWDLAGALGADGDDMFDKEIKKMSGPPMVLMEFMGERKLEEFWSF